MIAGDMVAGVGVVDVIRMGRRRWVVMVCVQEWEQRGAEQVNGLVVGYVWAGREAKKGTGDF